METKVVLLVLAASAGAVSPQRPPCPLIRRSVAVNPTYRVPWYPRGQGVWVCYYGGYPYPYGYGYPSAFYNPTSWPYAYGASPSTIPQQPQPSPQPAYQYGTQYPTPGRRARSATPEEQHLPSTSRSPSHAQPSPTNSSSPEAQQLSPATIPSPNTRTQKIEVSVVFSTGDIYTHDFFTQQLYPTVHALGTHLTLDLLPQLKEGCQPGSSDCLGGSLLVCAMEVLPIPALQLAFSACFVKDTLGLEDQSYPAFMNAAKMCMGSYSVLNWMQMTACVSSGRGELLFDAAAKRLQRLVLGPQNAPIVAFNQEVVIAEAGAMSLFPALLCHQLSHIPDAVTFCPDYSQLD